MLPAKAGGKYPAASGPIIALPPLFAAPPRSAPHQGNAAASMSFVAPPLRPLSLLPLAQQAIVAEAAAAAAAAALFSPSGSASTNNSLKRKAPAASSRTEDVEKVDALNVIIALVPRELQPGIQHQIRLLKQSFGVGEAPADETDLQKIVDACKLIVNATGIFGWASAATWPKMAGTDSIALSLNIVFAMWCPYQKLQCDSLSFLSYVRVCSMMPSRRYFGHYPSVCDDQCRASRTRVPRHCRLSSKPHDICQE